MRNIQFIDASAVYRFVPTTPAQENRTPTTAEDRFAGEAYNFERIDVDGDGFLTKKEIVDDMIPVLSAEGKLFIHG